MKAHDLVQVSAYYPPHLGGQENAVHDLAQQLAKAGYSVKVLTSRIGSTAKDAKNETGVHVRRMWGFVFGHAPIMPWFPIALFGAARAGSVVHLHIGQAFTPEMVWLVSKLRRFKYVAQLHIDFEPSGPAGILLPLYKRLILGRVLRAADSVIALNIKTLNTVRSTYGYTGRAYVISNGIDESYFSLRRPPLTPQPPDCLRLLFVGRLSAQKNVAELLKALRMTKRKVHLDVIGDGSERETIKKIISERAQTNVTLHGRLDRQDVMKFYETCDALIMPSLYEAQPLVLLEAMAARIPIIGTRVIGVEDHIKNAGILVEPTAHGLAYGIEQYFTRYQALSGMIERGYRMAQKLGWSRTLKKYKALYDEVSGN